MEAFNSASCSLIDGNGQFTSEDVRNNINKPEFYHTPLSKLVAVENTANRAGGTFWDFSELIAIKAVCNDNNLKFHLDGADYGMLWLKRTNYQRIMAIYLTPYQFV